MRPSRLRPDFYRTLQVDPAAHPEIITAAYRTLLRALGKHPDLGGPEDEAKRIIEAYATLSDPERRRAYDQWVRAHSAPATARLEAPRPLPERLVTSVRAVVPEYRITVTAPFARAFDLVLEGRGLFVPRIYVKAFSLVTRANWPTIFVLCKALRVARHGAMPSTDLLLVTAGRIEDPDAFIEAADEHIAPWAWNRLLVGVHGVAPRVLHLRGAPCMPRAFLRLRRALGARGGVTAIA